MKDENKFILFLIVFAAIAASVMYIANPEIPVPAGIEFQTISARNLSKAVIAAN